MSLFGSLSLSLTLLAIPLFANTPSTVLSPPEQQELETRIHDFYTQKNGAVMNRRIQKFSATSGQVAHPNEFLKGKTESQNPLINLSGAKASKAFQKHHCAFLKKNFSPAAYEAACGPSRSTIEKLDRPEDLMSGWVDESKITRDLDKIPADGKTGRPLWSDDYWKIQWGMTAYRYVTQKYFDNYEKAIAAYTQPDEWKQDQDTLSADDLATKIVDWSPAEKYDLTVKDKYFSLTIEQKEEGKALEDDDGNVEEWMGICDGWTAASIMAPKATKSVTVTGPDSTPVTWYPADIRSMASLSWARGSISTNFISTNCMEEHPATFPNGRLKDQQCFNTNPATFHLSLGNMIGINKLAFIMDASYDYQIWNQPVHSYKFTYFNPLNPSKRSKNWKDVVVPYDDTFKKVDRFQNPMTRGKRSDDTWDDSNIKSIVGVINTVVYLSETEPPDHTDTETDDVYDRTTYTYDLELEEKDGQLVPTGGEWHENTHPNFLWVPQKDTRPTNDNDDGSFDYSGDASKDVTKAAEKASDDGFPLCEVLSHLLKGSSGSDYQCASQNKRDGK